MAGQEFRLIDTRYSHPEWWAGRNNYKRLQWWWWLPSAHRKWSATSRGLSRQVKLIDVETDKHLGLLLSFQLAQAANAYMQAALLAGALLSLAYHTNAVPPWIAIVVAVAGVLILGVSGWIAIRAKALYDVEVKDIERIEADREAREDAERKAQEDAARTDREDPAVVDPGIRRLQRSSYSPPSEDSGGRVGQPADAYGNVSRNAPCPCGSGRKFKLCHGDPRNQPNN